MSPRHPGSDPIAQLIDRPLIETRISFNGGGAWQPLPAPKTFHHAKCDLCGGKPDCSLHLHGSSAWLYGSTQYPSVYSHPSAPGIIMASGNVGTKGIGLDENDG
jgi:sortilin